jgi:hypothetical protein
MNLMIASLVAADSQVVAVVQAATTAHSVGTVQVVVGTVAAAVELAVPIAETMVVQAVVTTEDMALLSLALAVPIEDTDQPSWAVNADHWDHTADNS